MYPIGVLNERAEQAEHNIIYFALLSTIWLVVNLKEMSKCAPTLIILEIYNVNNLKNISSILSIYI